MLSKLKPIGRIKLIRALTNIPKLELLWHYDVVPHEEHGLFKRIATEESKQDIIRSAKHYESNYVKGYHVYDYKFSFWQQLSSIVAERECRFDECKMALLDDEFLIISNRHRNYYRKDTLNEQLFIFRITNELS